MPRKRKLTPVAVRKIFASSETAKSLGERYGVSQNMIYLIRSRRSHKALTKGLVAPKRSPGGRPKSSVVGTKGAIDALADALLDRLIARFRGR
jgi:hypothetical protein